MKFILFSSMLGASALIVQNCAQQQPQAPAPAAQALKQDPGFTAYWFSGLAELSSFDVVQDRYGETRKAEQVNIFVTEDFSRQKMVKLDAPQNAGPDRVPILKLNWIRRFHTGIYDYSLMQSVFKPLDGSPALKTTTSIQDWCGHAFQQYNRVENGYAIHTRSYFESEGDQEVTLGNCLLEDELWTMIRLDPKSIPTGENYLVPSVIYHRFRHLKESIQKADIQIITDKSEIAELQVRYTEIPRTLTIRFQGSFPYNIVGWEETFNGAVVSKGTLKATWRGAYWEKNGNEYQFLRDTLKVQF